MGKVKIDWNLVRELKDQKNRICVRPALYETIRLDPEDYRLCSVCGGRGTYLETGDAHRSEGWVPCYHCEGGTIRTKRVMTEKPVYRVKAGSRASKK